MMDIVDNQTSRDRLRAADSDRERVAEQLLSAHGEGRLDLTEYDERVQQAWAARTYGELATLTADLPQPRPPVNARMYGTQTHSELRQSHWQHGRGRHRRRRGSHGVIAAWASVSLINVLIWALACLTTKSWIYPWWILVAVPWSGLLVAGWIGERAKSAEPRGNQFG